MENGKWKIPNLTLFQRKVKELNVEHVLRLKSNVSGALHTDRFSFWQ